MTVVPKKIKSKVLPVVLLGILLVADLVGMNVAAKVNIKNTFEGGLPEVIDDNGTLGALTVTNLTLPKDAHILSANMTLTPMPGLSPQTWNLTTGADFANPHASYNTSVVGDELILNTTTVSWATDSKEQWDEGFISNLNTDGGTASMIGMPGIYGDVAMSSSASNNIQPWVKLAPDGKMHAVWVDDRTEATGDIYYGVSTDNGLTYGSEHLVAGGAGGQRKPIVDIFGTKLYVIYQTPGPDASCSWTTYFTSSVDGGTVWTAPVNLTCSAHKETAIGGVADLAVDHAGNPHVVAMHENTLGRWIYYVKSSNGGTTWDTPKLVFQPLISVITDIEVDSQNRPWVFFKMEKSLVLKSTTDGGASWAKHFFLTDRDPMTFLGEAAMHMDSNDVVHAVWRDRRGGNEDIYYTQFNITTENITANVPVVDDPAKKDQNNPFVNVNSKGEVYVTMVDTRNDTTGDPYFSYSRDGGKTWSGEYRVDTAPDASSMDYMHVFFDAQDRPHFTWSDGRGGASKAYHAMGQTNGTTYFSKVMDLGKKPYAITKVDLVKSEPGGTNVSVFVHCSPDGIIWSKWYETFGDNLTLLQWDRFLQWKVELHNVGTVTPTVDKVVVDSIVIADNGYYTLPMQTVPDIAQIRVNWNIVAYEGTMGVYLSHNLSNWELLGKGNWKNYSPSDGQVYINLSMGTTGRSPRLSSLTVDYMVNSYPTGAALRFGDASTTPVWTKAGELRGKENVSLTSVLNDHIADWNAANPNATATTNIMVPVNISFGGLGRIKMEGLDIEYDRVPTAPNLKSPMDGAMLANQLAKFELVSSDGDSDNLEYEIQVSKTEDFAAVLRTFDSVHPGWDKTSYFSDVTAELTPGVSEQLPAGTYYWRGRTFDGTMWGPHAEPAMFIIDATAPNGTIHDAGATSISVDTLLITLAIGDPETGISQMVYGVGTTPEGKELRDSTPFNASQTLQITGLAMVAGPIYYVWVMAMNGAGIWSTKISTDGIQLAVPDVTIDYPEGVQEELTISITTSASDPGGAEIIDGDLEARSATVSKGVPGAWSNWREVGAGDGGDLEVTEFTGTEGIAFQFRFRAKNEHGFWSPYAEGTTVVRINALPQAVIKAPESMTAGKSALFDGNSSFDADGDTLTYEWAFDGGSKATTPTVQKSFGSAGSHTVSLKVCDSFGCNTTTATVHVKESAAMGTVMMAGIGAGVAIAVVIVLVAVLMMMRKKKAKAQEAVKAAAPAAPVSPYDNYPPLPPQQAGVPVGAVVTEIPQYPPPPPPPPPQQQPAQDYYEQPQQQEIPVATATATQTAAPVPEQPMPDGRRPSFEPPPQQ